MRYHVITGTLVLAKGLRLSGTGETDKPHVQEQLRELAAVKNSMGGPAYVVIEEDQASTQGQQGTGKSSEQGTQGQAGATDQGGQQTQGGDAAPAAVKLPDGVQQKDFDTVQEILKEAGYTFESAHALTDEALDKIKSIAAGRMALIRAVGAANGYAGPQE